MTRKEVASHLHVCGHTIRLWERRGMLTPVRINRRVLRYRPEDVQKLLQPE
jgi:DNA-binding transcriptional MerR regulator